METIFRFNKFEKKLPGKIFLNFDSLQNAIFIYIAMPRFQSVELKMLSSSLLSVHFKYTNMAGQGWRGALTSVTGSVFPSAKPTNGRDRSRLMPMGELTVLFSLQKYV